MLNIKNLMKVSLFVGITSISFSGCTTLSTNVYPEYGLKNQSNIEVSQDSTSGFFGIGSVKRTNLKYAFAAAATETKNKGYKYFSIILPHRIVEVYKNNSVNSFEDAYNVCDKGNDAFEVNLIGSSSGEKCESFIAYYGGNNGVGDGVYPVIMKIEYHNENRNDHVTFQVDEVLKSELLKDLNKEYFVTMSH